MALSKPIVINNFQEGIGASPVVGFSNIRNLSISDRPGIVYPNPPLLKDGTTTITERPIAFKYFSGQTYAVVGVDLWWDNSATDNWEERESSFASGKLAVWRDYLIGGLTTNIYFLDSLGNDYNIGGLTTTGHQMCIVLNDAVYIVGGNNITKLSEDTGETFDPTDSGTYTLEVNKLKLPFGVTAKCVTTWNNLLVIGGDDGVIYTWNGVSDYFADSSQASESNVQRLITVNRLVYAQIGNFGNWYFFDGIRTQLVKEMPTHLFELGVSGAYFEPEGVCEVNNKIYFGMETGNSVDNAGVYSLDLKTNALACEDQVLGGNTNSVFLGGMLAKGDKQYYIGWEEAEGTTSYGIDFKNDSSCYNNNRAYLETQVIDLVQDEFQSTTLEKITLVFANELATDDSAVVWVRENLTDAWTALGDPFQTVDTDGVIIKNLNAIPALKSIQLKIALNGGDDGARLKSIILK